MGVISRPVRVGAVAVTGLAITAFTGALASTGAATAATAATAAGQGFVRRRDALHAGREGHAVP